MGYRRDVVPVVGSPSLRVSSIQSAPPSTSESSSGRSRPPSHSPSLASETLVSSPSIASGGIHQPISLFPHPHPDRLHLSLWPLSGNVAKRQAFLRGLPTLSPNLLGHPPDALMTIDWQASLNGVPSLRVIRILPL